MSQPNIVLTGFMGTGKTTVGRMLADRTGRNFVDTVELIVQQTGRSIADLFTDEGEGAFRRMEATVARELSGRENLVIATGGRMMLDPLNALLLARNSVIICLVAEPREILARLANDGIRRPLLEVPDPEGRIGQLLEERADGYSQFHQVGTTQKSATRVVAEILAIMDDRSEPRLHTGLTSRLPVRHPSGQYQVVVGRGLLPKLAALSGVSGPSVVVTDSNVGPIYADKLTDLNPLAVVTTPAGEEYKRLETVRDVYGRLLDAGLDRRGRLIALGGGVVGDMAGFAAATYMRGIGFVGCPTTLLAMVDASVGGKTGVDLPQGKNLVGAFKQPEAVIADLETLKTLPEAELTSGMAEVIKHGLIASPVLLDRLETGKWRLPTQLPPDELQAIVVEAIMIKRDVVEEDPLEQGRRIVLNLGHTFAHAIEQVSGYRIGHGHAVAMGLAAAARLSAALGHCSAYLPERTEAILLRHNLPTRIPAGLSSRALLQVMGSDKKRAAGQLRFVLLRDVGDPFVSDAVPQAAVLKTLSEIRELA